MPTGSSTAGGLSISTYRTLEDGEPDRGHVANGVHQQRWHPLSDRSEDLCRRAHRLLGACRSRQIGPSRTASRIEGTWRTVFINNGGTHYLTDLKIYADGLIDCWGLVDLDRSDPRGRRAGSRARGERCSSTTVAPTI